MTAFNLEYNLKTRPCPMTRMVRRDCHPDSHLVCFAFFVFSPHLRLLHQKKNKLDDSLDRLIRFTGIGQLSKAIIGRCPTQSLLSLRIPEQILSFLSISLSSIYNIITDCTKNRLRSLQTPLPPSLFKSFRDPFRKRDRCRSSIKPEARVNNVVICFSCASSSSASLHPEFAIRKTKQLKRDIPKRNVYAKKKISRIIKYSDGSITTLPFIISPWNR